MPISRLLRVVVEPQNFAGLVRMTKHAWRLIFHDCPKAIKASAGQPKLSSRSLSLAHKTQLFSQLGRRPGRGWGVPVSRRGYKPSPRCLCAPEECIKGAPEPTINTAMPAQRHTHTQATARAKGDKMGAVTGCNFLLLTRKMVKVKEEEEVKNVKSEHAHSP